MTINKRSVQLETERAGGAFPTSADPYQAEYPKRTTVKPWEPATASALDRSGDTLDLVDDGDSDQQLDQYGLATTPLGKDQVEEESQIVRLRRWSDVRHAVNIAEELSEETLSKLGMRVVEECKIDESSRSKWMEDAKASMELAMQRAKEKTYPWPRASNVVFPLMTEAADQFAARAYPAIIPDRNVVKGIVIGDDSGVPEIDPRTGQPIQGPDGNPMWKVQPGVKQSRARRIGEHMSWQLLEEQPEWEPDTDTLLNVLPVVGCEFRKSYFDPSEGHNVSQRVSAFNVIINYWAKSMATAPRITEEFELYPYEITEHKLSGYYRDIDYGEPMTSSLDRDAPHKFLEQHRRYDLDGDGYAEPYIVTVHKDSQKIARISARFDPEGILINKRGKLWKVAAVDYYTKYDFFPNKEGGIYGMGFGHILKATNEAVNSTLNMLIDAGHLQNTGGGFIGKGLSMHSGAVSFKPGEYKVINSAGGDIRSAIVHLDHKGPSPVLFTLLGLLIEAGKDISSVKDVMTGDLKAQTISPTVFLAIVEQGMKVFSAIYKRVYRALKSEMQKLYRLNRLYLEDNASYEVGNQWQTIQREDYTLGSGVRPITDPKMVVDAVKLARAQFLMGFANDPMMNGLEIRRRALEAASIEDIDKILQPKPAPNPELIAKMAEMELKMIEVKASALMKMASAIKMLAEADEKVMEPFIEWAKTQMQMMEQQVDAIGRPNPGRDQGTNGGNVPGLETPPGNQGGVPVLQGLPRSTPPRPPPEMGGGLLAQ
jgi:chaperonin GroES